MMQHLRSPSKGSLRARELKAAKLKYFAESVLHNPEYRNELCHIIKTLGLKKDEVVNAFIDFDLDIFSYKNEIYSSYAISLVLHLHNLLEGSWHIDRQKALLELMDIAHPKSIIDIGFGVPSLYMREFLKRQSASITLCDFSEGAIIFARILLAIWNERWSETFRFIKADMREVSTVVGQYDLYIFQDSIEHIPNPEACLLEYIKLSPKNAKFLISLPLCPPIPMHYIAWQSKEEATQWITKCGLKILESRQVMVNPEVDIFASDMCYNLENYIILCDKI